MAMTPPLQGGGPRFESWRAHYRVLGEPMVPLKPWDSHPSFRNKIKRWVANSDGPIHLKAINYLTQKREIISNMTRIILIASGKGGVGKTTLAANLAIAMTRLGQDVIVVDANVSTGNLATHLGLKKVQGTLHNVLEGKARIEDVIYYHPGGVKFIPTGSSLAEIERKAKKSLEEALLDLVGKVDMIIIDAAAGLGEEMRKALKISSEILIITNPELPSIIQALKTHKLAVKHGLKPLGIVINRLVGKNYEVHKKTIEEFAELPVIAVIPEDEEVKKSINEQMPLVLKKPRSKAAKEIRKLAAKILNKEYIFFEKKNLMQKIRELIKK